MVSAQVSLFVVLGFLIETVNDAIEILEGVDGVFENLVGLGLLIDNHAIPALVESSVDDLVENHFTEFLQDSLHWKTNALCNVVNLNF